MRVANGIAVARFGDAIRRSLCDRTLRHFSNFDAAKEVGDLKMIFTLPLSNSFQKNVNLVAQKMEKSASLLQTHYGLIHVRAYETGNSTWFALCFGVIERENVYCRVHDACITSEVFGSQKCDCQLQLHDTMSFLQKNSGVLIYTPQEGRGCGLLKKITAYSYQTCDGFDTVQSDILANNSVESRDYSLVKHILADLHIESIGLITNNAFKVEEIRKFNIQCQRMQPRFILPWKHSMPYIKCKQRKMNHDINLPKLDVETVNCMNHIKEQLAKDTSQLKIVSCFATSLNGVYCSHDRSPLRISNTRTNTVTQCIRSISDCILVGSKTILSDNPHLDCKIENSNLLTKIILTSSAQKIPKNANVFKNGTVYILSTQVDDQHLQAHVTYFNGTVEDCISKIKQLGCRCLMVEGGLKVLQSFIHHSSLVVWTQNLNMMEGHQYNLHNTEFNSQKAFVFDDNLIICCTAEHKVYAKV